MRRLKLATLTVLAALLASCATHHYTLVPPPGKTAWTPDEKSAVVLIGFDTDETINSVTVAGDLETVPLASALFALNRLNVLAVHFHAGEKFRLEAFNYARVGRYASRHMTFKNLPTLDLDRPGIYYYDYGIFQSKDAKGAFSTAFDRRVVELAKRTYPKLFAELAPVNFQ